MSKKVHNVNEHRPVGGRNNHDASINRGKIKQTAKTVRIFAYSSTREHSNKRSGTRLKTESETGERRVRLARFARVRL